MNKVSAAILLAISMLFCACSDAEDDNLSLSQAFGQIADNSEVSGSGSVESSMEINYEDLLLGAVGADYFEGRAIMRADDEEIFGELCAVFKVGTNTDERFTTEEWLAVSKNSQVYKYDVAADEWSEFAAITVGETIDPVVMQNCIYALNEILSDEFSAEYYDTEDMIKIAVYESEESYNDSEPPAMLMGLNETAPEGYFDDPIGAVYMPVYSFNTKAEISEHFSLYFTDRYIDELRMIVDQHFVEFEGALYLVRGGMGYGGYSVDFDSLDHSNLQDNTLIVNTLFLGVPYGKVNVEFVQENGSFKIDSAEFILMYDLYNLNQDWAAIEVPDFKAFISKNMYPTTPDDFVQSDTAQETYDVTYLGDYYEELPEYVNMLERIGFNVIMDGYEGFYSLEKYADDYLLTVNAYFMNEEDGVVIELSKVQAVG